MVSKKIFFVLVVALFLSGLASSQADYELGEPNHSIEKSYSRGENLKGWINASFNGSDSTNSFTDSEKNSVRLIELLNSHSKHDFNCDPSDCRAFYQANNKEDTKSMSLNSGQNYLSGFDLDSNVRDFENFSLDLQSNAGPSCTNQIKVDILDDGSYESGNHKVSSSKCPNKKSYGCFNPSANEIQEARISMGDTYCQRIRLPEAPGFELGMWLKNESGKLNLTMELYKSGSGWLGDEGAKCRLDNSQIDSQGGEVSCDINYLVTEPSDYYVCAYPDSDTSFSGEYSIRLSTASLFCGFPSEPMNEETGSYQIYASPYKFDSVGNISIDNNAPGTSSVSEMIKAYIQDKNGNLSCQNNRCVVPINFASSTSQQMQVSGEVEYESEAAALTSTDELSDLSKQSALINSPFQKVFFQNVNFSLPNASGEHNYNLSYESNDILNEKISIEKGATIYSVNPEQTAVGLPTNFSLSYGEKDVSSFKWNFENDSNYTTDENKISHTFSRPGNKTLTVVAETSEGRKSKKSFVMNIGPASSVLEKQTSKKESSIDELKDQISQFGPYSSNAVEEALEISELESKVSEIKDKYSFDSGNVSDKELLQRILDLNVPESVKQSSSSEPLKTLPDKDEIDLDILGRASGNESIESDMESSYKDAIQSWVIKNTEATLTGQFFTADYGSGGQPLITTFDLEIDGPQKNYYVFLRDFGEKKFGSNDSWKDHSDYVYKEVSGKAEINFYKEGESDFEDLNFFVSPAIDELNVVKQPKNNSLPEEAGEEFNWVLYGVIVLGALILAGIAYYLLKRFGIIKKKNSKRNRHKKHPKKRPPMKKAPIKRPVKKPGPPKKKIPRKIPKKKLPRKR